MATDGDGRATRIFLVGLVVLAVWMVLTGKREYARSYQTSVMATFSWGWRSSMDFTNYNDSDGKVNKIEVQAPVKVIARRDMSLTLRRDNSPDKVVTLAPWEYNKQNEYIIKEKGDWYCYFPDLHPERSEEYDDEDPVVIVR